LTFPEKQIIITTMQNNIKRGRGRPSVGFNVKWNPVANLWKTNTDKELSLRLGVSVPLVFRKRAKLAANGIDTALSRPAYTRARKSVKAKFGVDKDGSAV
jgi:hypothetical protein